MSNRLPTILSVLTGLGLVSGAGCDGLLDPPPWTRQMVMHAALNPDSTLHPILVATTDVSMLSKVSVNIHRRVGGPGRRGWVLVATWDSARAAAAGRPLRDLGPCTERIGRNYVREGGRDEVCMTPEVALESGETYRVAAWAQDRDTASGDHSGRGWV